MALFGRKREPASRLRVHTLSSQRRETTPLVAAAYRVPTADRKEAARQMRLRQGWQLSAWAFRDQIGELRYALNFLANCAARMKVYPAAFPLQGETDNPVPLSEFEEQVPANVITACGQAMSDLGNGRLAVSQLMHTLSTNKSVAGECWLLGQTDPQTGEDEWSIRSITEIAIKDDRYYLREVPSDSQGVLGAVELDPELTVLSRIWTPHPQWRLLADSPLRAMQDTCENLLIYRRMIRANGRSRIAGNGMLLIPEEIELKSPNADNADPEADDFLSSLGEMMMMPLDNEGAASAVVPGLVRGPASALKEIRKVDLFSQFPEHAMKIRDELIGDMATGLDLPKEVVTGTADLNHWCLDEETEVLTQRGWLSHREMRVGDACLSLDHETGTTEWRPVSDIYRAAVVDEPMLSIEHRMHSSLTTMGHRWPVLTRRGREQRWEREWRKSDEFRTQDHLIVAAPAEAPAEAEHSDALVELIAWLWTEGGLNYRKGRISPQVSIYQSATANLDNVARIRRALTAIYGPPVDGVLGSGGRGSRVEELQPRWRETRNGDKAVFRLNVAASRPLVDLAPRRRVSLEFIRSLTAAQRELFIETSIRGDGCINKANGTRSISQKDPRLLEAFELAAILAGYSLTHHTREHDGFKRHVQHTITLGRRTTIGMQRGRREVRSYTGVVWCPTVAPTHTVMARRNGHVFCTGNSAWQVDDNTFRHHVEPHVIHCCDSLTGAFLRPYLEDAGVSADWADRLLFWYDPTELVTHPDQTADAKDLYDRHAISAEALARTAGFDPKADGPTPQEMTVRMLANMRNVPPNLVMAIVHNLFPDLTIPPITTSGTIPGVKPTGVDAGEAADGQLQLPGTTGTPAPSVAIDSAPPAVSPPADQTDQGPPQVDGITAASRPSHERLSRRLMQIDRELRLRLQVAANHAMLRHLERAGARLRSKVAKDETMRSKIAHKANERAAAYIGPELLTAAGINASDLLSGDWSGLQQQFDGWVAAAQKQALGVAARMAGLAADHPGLQRALANMAGARQTAWAKLQGALQASSERLLYSPDPNTEAGAWGDLNPDSLVPNGTIRAALAIAGGAGVDSVSETDDGTLALTDPSGGIGTGDIIGDLLGEAGGEVAQYSWEHGPSLHPFEGHEDLDGVEFVNFDDEALANDGDWPDNAYFMPGDHEGCSCDFTPLWDFPGSETIDTPEAP